MPRAPTLEDESHLGFHESLRNYAILEMFPRVAEQTEKAATAAGLPSKGSEGPLKTLVGAADALPLVGVWKRLMRSQQQRTWWKVRDTLLANAAHYERELDAAEARNPGRLHYDPSFVVPAYAALPIHLQPGGYVGDTLAGYVFHYGTQVFYQGQNDQDELHKQVASSVELPADGRVKRVLDLACSIGQATTALKERLPDAEIVGMDVALPLLRYAHKRATDLGIDVHFQQGLAEDTRLESGSFDAVLAYILFHEVPSRLFDPIIAEVARLLRPGGTFTVVDAPNGSSFPAGQRLWMQYDAQYNCEPYSPAFVAADLPALLEKHGLRVTHVGPTPTFLWRTTCTKL
jgi:2-polyprenyl-3-methyl-5-hydroxy-6-metoxy-1,4-benzoquinol methylase